MRQKGFILIPVVIVIFLIGVLGYFIYQNFQLKKSNIIPTTNSPTPSPGLDPTTDWEKYNFDELKLTFKIPNEYYLVIPEDKYFTGKDIIDFEVKSFQGNIPANNNYFYLTARFEPTLNLEATAKIAKDYCTEGGVWINCNETKVDGFKTFSGEHPSGGAEGSVYQVDIVLKTGTLTIGVNLTEENIALTNKILSTFKFAEK